MNEVDISLTGFNMMKRQKKKNNSKITKIRRIYSKSGKKKNKPNFFIKKTGACQTVSDSATSLVIGNYYEPLAPVAMEMVPIVVQT